MHITAIRLRRLTGTIPTTSAFWEERLARPIDIYEEYRHRQDYEGGAQTASGFRTAAIFVEIETNDGITGRAGPVPEPVASIIAHSLRRLLISQDPIATEKLWDQMHRTMVHGRQGDAMLAISAIDCALWDLKGKWLNQPVHRLLGGPTRPAIPAYASMLGFDVLDPAKVKDRAQEYKQKGYTAQKWFFRHGPASGKPGLHKNVELVETLREAVGEDCDLMFDCWQSMDVTYVVDLAERIEEYRPRWLEECVMPDRIDSYRRIKDSTNIPLAGAEHEYTRWGFKRFIDADALDVLQPDIYWCGGLSETLKIAACATTADLITIPHGHSSPATIHFSVTQSPVHTPYQEFLVKWNAINQHFLLHPITPRLGLIHAPNLPGLGMELDPAKIETQSELFLVDTASAMSPI